MKDGSQPRIDAIIFGADPDKEMDPGFFFLCYFVREGCCLFTFLLMFQGRVLMGKKQNHCWYLSKYDLMQIQIKKKMDTVDLNVLIDIGLQLIEFKETVGPRQRYALY